jgi:hypothetical protein
VVNVRETEPPSADARQPEAGAKSSADKDRAGGTATGTSPATIDDDETATVSVDQVLSVPEDRLEEFLDLDLEAPPESVRGVRIEPAPGSLAALMEEIGVDSAVPSSAGSWTELEPEEQAASSRGSGQPSPADIPGVDALTLATVTLAGSAAPRAALPPAAGRPATVASLPPPLPAARAIAASSTMPPPLGAERPAVASSTMPPPIRVERPKAAPHETPAPKSVRRRDSAPGSKRRPKARTATDGDPRRLRPPRRRRDGAIPPPPPDELDHDREQLAALARTSLYPAPPPAAERPLTTPDRGAVTASSEVAGLPAPVAAAREQAAAGQRQLSWLSQLAALTAVGLAAFAAGRWSTGTPERDEAARAVPAATGAAHDDRAADPASSAAKAGEPPVAAATGGFAGGAPTSPAGFVGGTGTSALPPGTVPGASSSPSDTPAVASSSAAGELPDAAPPAETATSTPEPAVAAEIDRQAAAAALGGAAAMAAACRTDGSEGTVPVTVAVTFAPSGRVTTANIVGGAFAGTSTGSCIAQAFRSARVPPFGGGPVTVQKTVLVR